MSITVKKENAWNRLVGSIILKVKKMFYRQMKCMVG